MAKRKYDWKLGVWKGLRRFLQFAIPLLLLNSELKALTLGAILELVLNWSKFNGNSDRVVKYSKEKANKLLGLVSRKRL